jgi:hypothetical protein
MLVWTKMGDVRAQGSVYKSARSPGLRHLNMILPFQPQSAHLKSGKEEASTVPDSAISAWVAQQGVSVGSSNAKGGAASGGTYYWAYTAVFIKAPGGASAWLEGAAS